MNFKRLGVNFRRITVLALLVLSFASSKVNAQNCTVNAGTNQSICPGTPFVLHGLSTSSGGFFNAVSPVWSQVAGPAVTIGAPIYSGNQINANVTGYAPGNTYTFRISARCSDGSQVYQDVVYTTLVATIANAGANLNSACPGNVTMAANSVAGGETGTWSIIGQTNNTSINSVNSPTTTITLPTSPASVTTFRWTITNSNGCISSSDKTITNNGGAPVNAGTDQTLSNCYNLTQATQLGASYAGNGTNGQQGTWSFVSGPSTPTFDDVHGYNTTVRSLVTGTYTLRWTVVGPCVSGQDEMTITVPPPTQSITGASNANLVFCDSRTSTVLSATAPGYTNETATWTLHSGTGTISDPNAATTVVSGLTPGSSSVFYYTIHNTSTGCTTTGTYNLSYTAQTAIDAIPDIVVLQGGISFTSIPYTATGGNQTRWQLLTSVAGSTIALSTTAGYHDIFSTPLDLVGLDKIGQYTIRLQRTTNNGAGGCVDAYDDVTIIASLPPTAANAGTTQLVACNVFSATLAGNVAVDGVGTWSQVSGPNQAIIFDPTDPGTAISGLANGAYVFRWFISGGQGTSTAQSDVTVKVADIVPTTANAGLDAIVCNGTPITLNGNTPALNEVGTWTVTPSSGVAFVNINDPKTKVTGLAGNSVYTFTWTVTNSCGTSHDDVVISTSNTAGPKQALAGSAQCLSSTTTTFNLAGNAPAGTETGNWAWVSGPNTPTITSSSSATTTVTGAIDGTYKFEWSLSTPTCAATRDTITITASASATTATVISPVNLCGATTITLAGNAPTIGTGIWTQVSGVGGAVITTPTLNTSTVTGIVSGSYTFRWTISNGACSSNYADVKYNISTPPTVATLTGLTPTTQSLCGVTSTVLNGNTITVGTGLWQVVSGPNAPTFSSISNPTATISGLIMGTYVLRWTSSNGANCPRSVSPDLTIYVTQNATANVISTGLCNVTTVELTGNTGSAGTWSYVTGAGSPTLVSSSLNTAIASGLTNGTYTYRYTIPAVGVCVATSATISFTITASPSVAQAGVDQQLCAGTSVILGGVTPAIGTGTWTIISQPVGSLPNFSNTHAATATFSNLDPGVYLLQWNVTNGFCGTNQDIVRITTFAGATTSVAGANQLTACTGNLMLNANTPVVGIGTWSQVSALSATIDAPNSPSTAVLNTAPGTYTFMWTISNGVCASSTSTVTITVTSTPPNPASAGPAQQICNPTPTASATLAGSTPVGGETGLWTISSKPVAATPTFGNATVYNTTVSNLIQGTYVLTWTVSNGSCVSSSDVTITVTDQPTPSNAGPDKSFCLYSPVALNATAVSTGVGAWSVTSQPGSTPAPVFGDVNSNTTTVNGLLSGDYVFTWITTNSSACASSMSSVTIHIVPPPSQALAGSFQTVCFGVNPTLTANLPSVGTGSWAVITTAGGTPAFTNISAYNSVVTGLVAGVYTFSWTITNGGCTSSDQTQVTVQPAIANNIISAPQIICSGSTPVGLTGTTTTGGNGTFTYQWEQSTTSAVAGFSAITGATSSTYSPAALTTTTWYRRVVSSGFCLGAAANTSTPAQITVQPPLTGNAATLPATATFCQSGDPDVILGGTPAGGDGATYTYVWEQSTTSALAGFSTLTGITTQDYDPSTLTASTWFRRTVTSGSCTNTGTAVKITINPYAVLTSVISPAAICSGATFSYSPTASIGGTTFTWTRSAIASINTNAGGSGSQSISETLTSTSTTIVPVQYLYTLTTPLACTNPVAFSVTVNVNPTPNVNLPSNQVICNGLLTSAINFTGSVVASTTYNWTNTTTSIGLAASGSGNINAFTATNNTNVPVTAILVVTPVSNACSGAAQTFSIVVNPTAAVTAMATSICTGTSFNLTPTNVTNGVIPAGTTYTWSAPSITGTLIGGATGAAVTSISGTLSHTNSSAQTATYIVTPNTAACGDGPIFTVTVTVNPVAAVNDMTTTICAGVTFTVTPADVTNGRVPAGTKYTWSAPAGSGFTGGASQGGGGASNITGNLTNSTSAATTATYTVTPTSGTCAGAQFTVTVSLNPKGILAPLSITTCSGIAFASTPVDGSGNILPSGTTFSWASPTGGNFTGGASNAGPVAGIFGTLINTSNAARTITYLVTPLSNGCTGNTFSTTITLNPVVSITDMAIVRCSGVSFIVTPANVTNGTVPVGTTYTWSSPFVTGTTTGGGSATNATNINGTLSVSATSAETGTYTVTPATASCGAGAQFSLTVSINPIASINALSTVTCGGVSFLFTPANGVDGVIPSGTKYTWSAPTGSFTGAGAATNTTTITGTLTNTLNTAVTATYVVTPQSPIGCNGTPFNVIISLNPKAIISAMTATICNGASFTLTPTQGVNGAIVPSGTTYSWPIPLGTGYTGGASGSGSVNVNGTLANSSNSAKSATYTITPLSANGCTGNAFQVTVTVNPIAAVTDMTGTTCSGVAFSVTPADVTNGTIPSGTLYSWVQPTGAGFTGGLTQSPGSSLPGIVGTLTNITSSAVTATYTVTPVSGLCSGAAFTVSVTVSPKASVNAMSVIACNGVFFNITPTDVANGIVPNGTTYAWTAPSGANFTGGATKSGQNGIFGTLTSLINTPQTVVYTITPTSGTCTGASFAVTVTLNPSAVINAMAATICSGGTFTLTPTNGTNGIVPSGTTYTWTSPAMSGTLTGGTSGSGTNIFGTLSHTNTVAQTATYTVTPSTGACGSGATFAVTITVNPIAAVTDMTTTACGGVSFTVTPTDGFNGSRVPSATKYTWSTPGGTGFTGGASQGGGGAVNITGNLTNSTSSPVTATYTVTPTTGTCAGSVFSISINLNPKGILAAISTTTCSGVTFALTPVDGSGNILPSATTFTWPAPTGAGFTGGATQTTQVGGIFGLLTNTTNSAKTVTYLVTPLSGSCSGNVFSVTVTLNAAASVNTMTSIVCSGVTFTVTPTNVTNGIVPAGTTYRWPTPSVTGGLTGGLTISLSPNISGTLTNPTNSAQTATYTVTPTTISCGDGAPFSVVVSISASTYMNPLSITTCSGVTFNITPVNGTDGIVPNGTTYQWGQPTAAGITGGVTQSSGVNHIFGTLTNTTNTAATITYLVTPTSGSCVGAVFSVTVSVSPAGYINPISTTVCSGTSFTVTPTNGSNGIVPSGSTYAWSLPTGTGFTGGATATNASTINGLLTNTTNTVKTATYLVTPTSGNCTGAVFSVTVNVNPTPVIIDYTGLSMCNGTLTFTPSTTIVPAGTTYTWPAASGSGFTGGLAQVTPFSIFSTTLNNPTSSALTATFQVSPVAGACTGAAFTVSITINPSAAVTAMSGVSCSGVTFTITPADVTNGVVPSGTTYTWSAAPTGTGFTGGLSQASAITNITGNLTNTTNAAVTAFYFVTPHSGICIGSGFTVTVTINPAPSINAMTAVTCNGSSFVVTPTNGTNGIVPLGTTYSWSAPAVTGGMTGGAIGSNAGNISGTLSNTTNTAQTATYTITPNTSACGNGATFTVTVSFNPVAIVTDMTSTTCSGILFTVSPAQTTNGIVPAGTTYSWTSPTGSGFTGQAAQGSFVSSISGTLTATTSSQATATYLVTPKTGTCTGAAFSVTITLNPAAYVNALSTTTCSGVSFAVTPVDSSDGIVPAGTTYSWTSPTGTSFTGGLTGTGTSITGTLTNTANTARTATYLVTLTSGNCTGTVFSLTVNIQPTASINAMAGTSCSGVGFTITPVNSTNGIVPAGTTYRWSIPSVTGGMTGGASATGATSINGTLNNLATNSAQTATYIVTPTTGCGDGAPFTVTVSIRAVAYVNAMSTTTCSGVGFTVTPANSTDGVVPSGTTYSWSAPTGSGFTGGATGSAQSNINGNLTNTGTTATTAFYTVTPLAGSCTGAAFTVTVNVNPAPILSSTLTPAAICNTTTFSYTATSATSGTSFTWSRTTVTGITSGGAATGTGNISQTLTNSTTAPLSISYVYSLTANGCTNSATATNTVTVVVNPTPVLTSSLTPATIYNATTFSYTATSATPGTTYAWTRAAVAGINSNLSGSGSGAVISEVLTNSNLGLTSVVYALTLTANGCTNAQTVTVGVSPTPVLSSSQTPGTICSGILFAYTATSATPSTTFTWTRAAISSINGNATGSGSTAAISETLTNTSAVPVSVVYTVVLTANGFSNTQNVTVVVNPTPSVNQPSGQSLCNNTLTTGVVFSGFVAGTTYSWTNTTTSIGLAASGSGTIAAFTATNTSTANITAVITVTPLSNTCAGAPVSFSITVKPTPVLSSTTTPAGICTGSTFTYAATSATTGTSFTWSRTIVTGIAAGGAATGTGDVSVQTLTNSTTAPLSVGYVYSLTANSCANVQTVTVAVNPTPSLTSTLTPTAVFGGTAFVYTPTSATPSTSFTWTRATLTTINNAGTSGSGTINESLINNSASAVNVVYVYTLTASGCSNAQSVTISIIPSNIDAVNDDFSADCVDGAKGGHTASVLSNDILNSVAVDPSLVNMSIVSDGGVTGVTINSLGQIVIPAKTTEGTYTITYNICVSANPGNCDQASVTMKVCRGLYITTTAVCIHDVPYINYKVEPNFIPATGNPVTLKWLNGDKSVLTAQPVVAGTALEARILWPGAVLDSLGNPIDWPGWFISNGLWVQGADGFEGTRPNAYLVISVNPTDTIMLSYPPATPACAAVPTNHPPVAVNDKDSVGQCSPVVINVLRNDSDFENGTLTVSLPSATSAHNGTIVVNTNGTVTYTPPSNYTGTDTFSYVITDAAGLTASATVTITVNSKPTITGGIIGTCAIPKDSTAIYSVGAVANATNYVWTLPVGWTGSSTTNSINIKPGNNNGTITVVPYNGGCAGTAVSYNVSVIDFAKVSINSAPNVVKGDANSTSTITIVLYDKDGNPIHCSGGIASLCTSSGTFTQVVDNGDGTYTSTLRSSANNAVICGSVGGVMIQQTVTTVFTGPQGSIKGNGPIFETETPLLTFNFTAGVGPFTVVYKAAGSTKNDTLNNVTSNVAFPVKSISATKLYTLVSIIGSDNARRDNNFTRDTATILVVEPKIVITLTADNPKFLADNLYGTVLRMKVKNIGAINLASVQVMANLVDVFPNPVQFVLDSVKQAGRQTVPNGHYDGKGNLDLFSWNSRPGMRSNLYNNTIASAPVPAMVYGENTGNGSTGINTTDGESASDKIQVPFLPGYTANHAENANTTATENNGPQTTPFFFGTLSKLDVGEETDMELYVRIIPNGYFQPFVMQAVALGTGHTEFGTALANSLSNDDGNSALHPELTHDGDPLPTVINVFPNPVLGAALSAGTPVLQLDGTYNVPLSYLLHNYGNVNLRSVKLFEDLKRSIGTPATFNVIGAPVATGNLLANPSYDGKIDTNMLAPNSMLGVGLDAKVTFTINITPNQLSALYRLYAIATGFNTELSTTITDISTNGTNPDPDGNGIPDEKLITPIPINMTIPPLLPGGIGIKEPPATVQAKTFCVASTITAVSNSATTGGSDPYQYQWQVSVDNTTFTNIAGATDSIYTGVIGTSSYLRRSVISGSQQAYSNSVRIIISAIPKPVITASGSLNLTQSGTITLTSSAAVSYLWSTNATTGSIVVNTAGGYKVTITDANGCSATSDLVAINPPPPTTVNRTYIIGAITNPPNSGIQVTGLTGATLKYYTLSASGVLIPVPVLPNIIGVYTYYVSQVVNGYESVLVPYTVTMLDPNKVADIQKVTSKGAELQADGSYIVKFTIISSNLRTEQLDSVKIKDDLTKVFPASVSFQVVSVKTSGKLIANELYNGNSQIELLSDGSQLAGLQKDSIILSVRVYPNGFSGQLNNVAIQVAKSIFGTFTVNSNDPTVGDGLLVRAPTKFIIPATDIFIPGGFSPNRDGVNDLFVITRPFNTTINLEIFNRWGNLVYRSADYNNQWNGKGNQPNNVLGEDLPDGTYYYIVLATDKVTGNVRKFAGFITLKR